MSTRLLASILIVSITVGCGSELQPTQSPTAPSATVSPRTPDEDAPLNVMMPGPEPGRYTIVQGSIAGMRAKGYQVFDHRVPTPAEAAANSAMQRAAKLKFVLSVTDADLPAGVLAKVYRGPGALGDATIVMSRRNFSRPLQLAAQNVLLGDFAAVPTVTSFRALEIRTDSKVHTPEGEAKPYWMPSVAGRIDANIQNARLAKSEAAEAAKTLKKLDAAPTAIIDGRLARWISM